MNIINVVLSYTMDPKYESFTSPTKPLQQLWVVMSKGVTNHLYSLTPLSSRVDSWYMSISLEMAWSSKIIDSPNLAHNYVHWSSPSKLFLEVIFLSPFSKTLLSCNDKFKMGASRFNVYATSQVAHCLVWSNQLTYPCDFRHNLNLKGTKVDSGNRHALFWSMESPQENLCI